MHDRRGLCTGFIISGYDAFVKTSAIMNRRKYYSLMISKFKTVNVAHYKSQ